jgi:hypothetical protein
MKVHQTLEWLNLLSLGTKGLKPRQQSVYSQGSVTGGGWRGEHLNSQQHSLTTPIRHIVLCLKLYSVLNTESLTRAPLLPGPARTPRPVQPKKFGRWRKNSAANCYPRNQHFIQYCQYCLLKSNQIKSNIYFPFHRSMDSKYIYMAHIQLG